MTDEEHVTLTLASGDAKGCKVSFEPFGAEHVLAKGDFFYVDIRGPGPGEVELLHLPTGLVVVAWPGAAFTVKNRAGAVLRM